MRKQFGLVLLLTLTLSGPAAVAQSTIFHSSGNFASLGVCFSPSATTVECITVSVFAPGGPAGAAGQTQTVLFYDDSIADSSTFLLIQDTNGSGLIPNTAFQVHGNTDSLNVDTSKVPNFDNVFCTFDSVGTPTCNPASGGLVTGTWNAIANLLNFQSSGTTREVSPGATFITTGTSNQKPAVTSVSVLGVVLTNVPAGDIGQEHNTTINIVRQH